MANAKRDENSVPTLIAVSNVDFTTPVQIYADPVTHRLLVDLPGSGSGDVVGPAGATDNAIARFDGVTGKLIQNSTALVDDNGSAAVNTIQLRTTPTVASPIVGELYYNAVENGLPEYKVNANSSLTIGAEMYAQVVNKTGSTLTDGQVVYISGAQGNRPTATLARADSLSTCRIIGVITADIANNAEGFVTIVGDVHGFNTSGFTAGDTLYLSSTVAGGVTNVAPSSPNYKVIVGKALNSTINGLISVRAAEPIALNTALGTDDVAPSQGAVKTYADAKVADSITDGVTTIAPSQNAVFDALALKANLISPSFTTPSLGVATATSINKVTITAPATSATLTIANGKTLTANNSITLAGTDSTTMTFPTTSKTIAANDGSNWAFASQAAGDIAYASSASAYTRLAKGTDGQVLTLASGVPSWATPSAGGASFWTTAAGTPTRASNTTFTVTGDYTSIFAKGMVIKWTETGTVRVGMVAIPSTYGAPNTTVTIVGDTMASIDASSLKYALIGAEMFTSKFSIAGTIGTTGTDVANAYYATEPMRVIGADLQVGTAGTTNSTTIDINKGGTTMFTTKPTLATTVASSPTPFTADSATSLALGDKVTIDIDAVQTTAAIDLYAQLYLWPTRYNNL